MARKADALVRRPRQRETGAPVFLTMDQKRLSKSFHFFIYPHQAARAHNIRRRNGRLKCPFGALQDFVDQACALACQNSQVRTKTYQSTFSNSLSKTMAVVAGMSQSANNGPRRCRSVAWPGWPVFNLGMLFSA